MNFSLVPTYLLAVSLPANCISILHIIVQKVSYISITCIVTFFAGSTDRDWESGVAEQAQHSMRRLNPSNVTTAHTS